MDIRMVLDGGEAFLKQMIADEVQETLTLDFKRCAMFKDGDVPPLFRTIFGWDFPVMIPGPGDGDGDFHESFEVFGGAGRLCSQAG